MDEDWTGSSHKGKLRPLTNPPFFRTYNCSSTTKIEDRETKLFQGRTWRKMVDGNWRQTQRWWLCVWTGSRFLHEHLDPLSSLESFWCICFPLLFNFIWMCTTRPAEMEERFRCFDVKPKSLIIFLGKLSPGSLGGCHLTASSSSIHTAVLNDIPPHHGSVSFLLWASLSGYRVQNQARMRDGRGAT